MTTSKAGPSIQCRPGAARPSTSPAGPPPPAVAGPLVHEMNRGVADLRPVVGETVQLPLGSPPVEPVSPVAKQPFQPVPVGALRPPLTGRRRRQPSATDPCPHVSDHRRNHGHRERLDANL